MRSAQAAKERRTPWRRANRSRRRRTWSGEAPWSAPVRLPPQSARQYPPRVKLLFENLSSTWDKEHAQPSQTAAEFWAEYDKAKK